MLLNNLRNLISEPTCIKDTYSTPLDPISVSDENIVLASVVMQTNSIISDQAITYLYHRHNYKVNKSHKRKVWINKKANYEELNEKID